jgi:hypothetical protein
MNTNNEKLVEAYHKLLEALKSGWQETEKHALPPLKEGLETAKQKLSDWGEVTREELDDVADYLKRDLEDAAGFLNESGKELGDWLKRDLEFAEIKAAELFASMADVTRIELDKLAERARKVGEWRTGEITGVGVLQCKECGELLHFEKPGHIPPCPKCHGTTYRKMFAKD